ncbi:MAG: hypothetical protein N2506_01510 [Dehalococcoidales bacterium]|nr:hypothetical protein [Dehalococcoidales bacterium]
MMPGWDRKYFVTELKDVVRGAPWTPKFADNEARRLLSLDSEVLKGAFYMETAWFFPGDWPRTADETRTIKAHRHDYDEAVAWVGTDPHDPYNLNGEIEFWIDGRPNVIDRSFIAFIPAGVEHGPIRILKIEKPMFHFTAGMSKYYRK